MKIVVNDTYYPLHGYTDPSEYEIIGVLSFPYYLVKGKDGSTFALYLPNTTEFYPIVS